jgi:phosphoribosylglycinamide formyltransferase-1
MNEINKSEDAFKRRGQKNYRNYLIQMKKNDKNKIVIFASGAGSNAQKIIDYFKERKTAEIVLIVCNNPKAAVLQIAAKESIPVLLIEKNEFSKTGYLNEIKKLEPDLIILAGFLWKIPQALIENFPHQIINIHPALLPNYGGKGMYGNAVHTAVIEAKEKESGITIHYVDEKYDHGETILQAKCKVTEVDNTESLAKKIHELEHEYFPKTIDEILTRMNS